MNISHKQYYSQEIDEPAGRRTVLSSVPFRRHGFEFYYIADCRTGTIIHLSFDEKAHSQAQGKLRELCPGSTFCQNRSLEKRINKQLGTYLAGQELRLLPAGVSPFIESGTDFQKKVWGLISEIPYGRTRTYGELARDLGGMKYARAVGNACNANPLALIIPCHRVVGVNSLGGFAGGEKLKRKLLALERAGAG